MLTAQTIEREYLFNALDAIAANDEQALLIYNPSPEVDSLVEDLQLLARTSSRPSGAGGRHDQAGDLPSARLVEASRRLAALRASNGIERRFVAAISGAADRDSRSARDLALNGGGEAVLTAKAIARAARGPLKVIADPAGHDAMGFVGAVRAVDQLLRRAPHSQVFSPTVRHEIGETAYQLLHELAETKDAAAGSSRAASKTLGTGEGHVPA